MTKSDYTDIINLEKYITQQEGTRLDKLLPLIYPDHSRTALQKLIIGKNILINDVPCQRSSQKIFSTQKLSINWESWEDTKINSDCLPEDLPLTIEYEDETIIIINKPSGLVTHPGHNNQFHTLQAGLLHHHPSSKTLIRAGLVHRLDKDTSGLLVVAKTKQAQKHLISQFKSRTIRRDYLALVHGRPILPTGLICLPIGRSRRNPLLMVVSIRGKEAITRYMIEQSWDAFSLLRCRLETGRTHQIRVHLRHHGHPIVGDLQYQNHPMPIDFKASHQLLHATSLHLLHPVTEKKMHWNCPLPADFQKIISEINSPLSTI